MNETLELTADQWEIADRISVAIEAEPEKLWTVSALARKIKATHGQVWPVLAWMEENVFVIGSGNGAWRKYRARRFGEYGKRA